MYLNTFYLRTDPLFSTASLIQSYTQHVLKPHIDKESEHQRFFLKIPFINKGIDFIDLQSTAAYPGSEWRTVLPTGLRLADL